MPSTLCLNGTTFAGHSLRDALDAARAAGIGYIELSGGRSPRAQLPADISAADFRALQTLLRDAGVAALSVCAHRDLRAPGQVEEFRRQIARAHRLGCRRIVTGLPDGAPAAELAAALAPLAQEAQDAGMCLCLETHGHTYATGAALLPLVRAVDHPALAIAYDTANPVYYGNILPYGDLAACLPFVRHFHLKDKAGAQDEWNFPAIGQGALDFARIVPLVLAAREATVSIEIEFTPAGVSAAQAAQAVRDSVQTLKRLYCVATQKQ